MEIPLIEGMRGFVVVAFEHEAARNEYRRAQINRAPNIRQIEANFLSLSTKFGEVEQEFKHSCLSYDLTPLQINMVTKMLRRESARLNREHPDTLTIPLLSHGFVPRPRRKARRPLLVWDELFGTMSNGWFDKYEIKTIGRVTVAGEECLKYSLMYGEECLIEECLNLDDAKQEAEDNERDERIDRADEERKAVTKVRLLAWGEDEGDMTTSTGKHNTLYELIARPDGRIKIVVDGETEGTAGTIDEARDLADVIEHRRTTDIKAELEAAGLFTGR